jgi:hypothetical protein
MNRAAEGLKMGLFHADDKLMNCSASEWALREFLKEPIFSIVTSHQTREGLHLS